MHTPWVDEDLSLRLELVAPPSLSMKNTTASAQHYTAYERKPQIHHLRDFIFDLDFVHLKMYKTSSFGGWKSCIIQPGSVNVVGPRFLPRPPFPLPAGGSTQQRSSSVPFFRRSRTHKMLRIIHGKMLNSVGIKNQVVQNGKEAIDLHLSGQTFDLILIDMDMPIMNGIQTSRAILTHINLLFRYSSRNAKELNHPKAHLLTLTIEARHPIKKSFGQSLSDLILTLAPSVGKAHGS
ncbi:hypothetical protein PIB30_024064 [Stylosanthes scabra]|uniref:Response regulatory domain-containing protein n=1 Tax=Stylosanthes scabra TaxID=79078 RepID=A0ABU6S9N3_9FABA|nr:hypothetical protein [Stylosanthes scabra]